MASSDINLCYKEHVMAYFLGIDLGTSGVKSAIVGEDGNLIGTGYMPLDIITEKPMWAEQSPIDWWDACKFSVKQAVSQSGIGKYVVGIGISGQMLGSTFLDRNKELIGNSIIWLDQRSIKEVEWLKDKVGIDKLINLTSNIPLTGYWAPKLMWIKNNEPDKFEKIKHVLFPKDYIKYMFTGEISLEYSDLAGSYLFDVVNKKIITEMFELCGLPRDIISENIIESQGVAGYLKADIATDLGLTAGIPVMGGAGDQAACALGSGIFKEGIASVTIGTSGVVYAASNKPIPDFHQNAAMCYCHSVPNIWSLFGCTLAAGGSFKWLRDILFSESSELYENNSEVEFRIMSGLADKAAAGSEGLIFLPYLNGERTPYPDPYARGTFFGLSLRHGKNEIIRSVMEGVTYSLRDTIELLRAADVTIQEIRASGGGAKSKLWMQIQADVFNTCVVKTNVSETGCVGAAILAAIGSGHFRDAEEACNQIIKPISFTEPIMRNTEMYNDYYCTYRSLYSTLKSTYKNHAELVNKWI